MISRQELNRKLNGIALIALDVDGVLTDGRLYFDENGSEGKCFYARDGLGIAAARRAGLKIAWITSRKSELVARRAAELGIDFLFQGISDKAQVLNALAAQAELDLQAVAYIGDDLNDLPALRCAGLSAVVADAAQDLREQAASGEIDLQLSQPGGRGAVRELIELTLSAQGKWEEVVESYAAGLEPGTS